ncbi:hypothetical protein B0H11DRAFT_2218000 [Mycena galericulata]|nr:hypothetical protein B0H11DRAFT_2218000 [Mycena galericulata]
MEDNAPGSMHVVLPDSEAQALLELLPSLLQNLNPEPEQNQENGGPERFRALTRLYDQIREHGQCLNWALAPTVATVAPAVHDPGARRILPLPRRTLCNVVNSPSPLASEENDNSFSTGTSPLPYLTISPINMFPEDFSSQFHPRLPSPLLRPLSPSMSLPRTPMLDVRASLPSPQAPRVSLSPSRSPSSLLCSPPSLPSPGTPSPPFLRLPSPTLSRSRSPMLIDTGTVLLSPLRLFDSRSLSLPPSCPPSPTSTLVGSQGTSPLKPAACNGVIASTCGGTEMEGNEDSTNQGKCSKCSSGQAGLDGEGPRRSKRVKAREDGGGDAGNGRVPGQARRPCKRGGDDEREITQASRVNQIAASVAGMRRQLEEEEPEEHSDDEQGEGAFEEEEGAEQEQEGTKGKKGKKAGKRKKVKKKGVIWLIDGEPPVAKRNAALRLVQLSMIPISFELQHKLADFLLDITPDVPPSEDSSQTPISTVPTLLKGATKSVSYGPPTPFVAALTRCLVLEQRGVNNDFDVMMSYIEAALYIQRRKTSPRPRGKRPPSHRELAIEVGHPSVDSRKIAHWYQAGTRLIYLAAASSMFIIPMIAVAGLKHQICKSDHLGVIELLSYLLCNPHATDHQHRLSKDCGDLTRTLIVPQMDSSGVVESIKFCEIEKMAARLRQFDTGYWMLPRPDSCWEGLQNPLLAPALPLSFDQLTLTEACVAEEITIKTDFDLKATPCPVNPDNSYTWTEAERAKALEAPVVQSFKDLKEQLASFHVDGEKTRDGYICIPSEICEGKVLTLRDRNDGLVAMLITNLTDVLPHLQETSIPIVSAIMEGEVYPVNSDKPKFKFFCTHKVIWNRYTENGDNAPKEVHPNFVRKEGATHVNHGQRAPYPSEEMTEDPEETELLAEFVQLITTFIEFHLVKLLPKEHASIKVYATRLPLHERSHAHPFGGFVFNVRVSTRGHRDSGDKLFCVVLPFGSWTGGEVGMFEPGFLFRPRAWDGIIFPSCNITHFNMNFNGIRLSLVLHSDKYGDRWKMKKKTLIRS